GVAWNAGMFVWRRRAIRSAIERYSGLIGLLEPTIRAPALLAHAYEQLKPVSIDVALMESAARDGKVVMGSMDVGWSDIGSWTELLAAASAGGTGSVVQPGDRLDVNADDLGVRRADGAVRVIRPLQAGSMTATQPIAVLRGADPRAVEALLARCAEWEEAPSPRPCCGRRPGSCAAPRAGARGSPTSSRSRTSVGAQTASRAASWSA